MANQLRLEQNLEYQQSLLQDQLLDIKRQRAQQRQQVDQILTLRIPDTLENLLTQAQNRMLRLYRSGPNQLTETERAEAQLILARLDRLRSGGCYNLNPDVSCSATHICPLR